MKLYSRYTPFNSKADSVFSVLKQMFSLAEIPFEIEMKESNYPNYKVITVIYDSADVLHYIETHNNISVGRKPTPLPSREELLKELEDGSTKKELAQKYGVSRPTLYKRLGLHKKNE
ncbi:MAG: helix-turn-helix domain-containing protein [Bacillota bacterium]|nr:helix-turn-helix domain-containing protein [Bacillota bacterium]